MARIGSIINLNHHLTFNNQPWIRLISMRFIIAYKIIPLSYSIAYRIHSNLMFIRVYSLHRDIINIIRVGRRITVIYWSSPDYIGSSFESTVDIFISTREDFDFCPIITLADRKKLMKHITADL